MYLDKQGIVAYTCNSWKTKAGMPQDPGQHGSQSDTLSQIIQKKK